MQGPVVSSAFLVANMQLSVPLLSLSVESKRFCQPFLRSRLLFIIIVVYTMLSYAAILVRPDDVHLNPFQVSNFSRSYRIKLALLVTGGQFVTFVTALALQKLLSRRQQRKVSP